jgi:fluoride exporter
MTLNVLWVFLGGGIGATARYWMTGVVYRWWGSGFPYGTLLVNLIGCFLIGLLMTGFEERFMVNPSLRIFLTVGILGGFTTFSTFGFETIAMMRDAEYLYAFANIGVSVIVCLGATYIGTLIGKLL